MAFDNNNLEDSLAVGLDNVGNEEVTNTANLGVTLDTVGNVDDSTNNSGNLDVGVADSFNEETNTESWNIDGSGNTESWDVKVDLSDNSTNDNSVNAGVREYNLGFTGGAADAAAGAGEVGGDFWVNNQNTVLDQSFSGNIVAGAGVTQGFENIAVVSSGEGSIAAGGDVDIAQSLDSSTSITSGGDVLLNGSSKTVDVAIGSNNESTVDIEVTDASQDWTLDNVGNDYSAVLDIEGSFTTEESDVTAEVWDIDADVVWDSTVVSVGDVAADIDI